MYVYKLLVCKSQIMKRGERDMGLAVNKSVFKVWDIKGKFMKWDVVHFVSV